MRPLVLLVLLPLAASAALPRERIARLLGLSLEERRGGSGAVMSSTTPLRCQVRGTLVARSGEWSSALVQCGALNRRVWLGDRTEDGEVIAIAERQIAVRRADGDVWVGTGPTAPPQAPAAAQVVSRAMVDGLLADPPPLTRHHQFVPAFSNGKALGIKAMAIPEGSPLKALGLEKGDIVQRVNGIALDTPEHALEALRRLSIDRRFDVELQRGGAVITRTVVLE